MALIDSVLVLNDSAPIKIAALGTATSSSEQTIGRGSIFWINATQDITIKLGDTGMGAAAATDMRIPANSNAVFQMHNRHDFIRVFNLSATTAADVYIKQLSRS